MVAVEGFRVGEEVEPAVVDDRGVEVRDSRVGIVVQVGMQMAAERMDVMLQMPFRVVADELHMTVPMVV